jgi:excisionase family DNA binding protein
VTGIAAAAAQRQQAREGLPPVLRIHEAAALLRIGTSSAYRLAEAGQLPGAFRLGSRGRRVWRDRLLAAIAERAQESAPDEEPGGR